MHTGATPPWLRDEDEDDDGTFCHKGPIGPSEEDFMAWSEWERFLSKFHFKKNGQMRNKVKGKRIQNVLEQIFIET